MKPQNWFIAKSELALVNFKKMVKIFGTYTQKYYSVLKINLGILQTNTQIYKIEKVVGHKLVSDFQQNKEIIGISEEEKTKLEQKFSQLAELKQKQKNLLDEG